MTEFEPPLRNNIHTEDIEKPASEIGYQRELTSINGNLNETVTVESENEMRIVETINTEVKYGPSYSLDQLNINVNNLEKNVITVFANNIY